MPRDYEQLRVERDGPIMVVTLNRPEQMNAWTWTMDAELGDAFTDAEADESVRVIVVTGAGRAFCAGADLSGGRGTFAGESEALGTRSTRERKPSHQMATPIIAAINGAAVGAGLTMAVEWDLRVAATDAKLGFVFNRRGMMADAELLWLVPRLIGVGPAMELLLTGRIFSGAEAVELGLVHRAVPAAEVLDCALDMARDIAANTAPASAAVTKRLLYEFLDEDRGTAWRRQNRMFNRFGRQPDAREGVSAFLERREPRWSGSKHLEIE